MDIFKFLEKIRRKPEPIRRQILWILVLIFMLIIVSFWFVSLSYSLRLRSDELGTSASKMSSPFENIKSSLGDFMKILDGETTDEPSLEEKFEFEPREINPLKLPVEE